MKRKLNEKEIKTMDINVKSQKTKASKISESIEYIKDQITAQKAQWVSDDKWRDFKRRQKMEELEAYQNKGEEDLAMMEFSITNSEDQLKNGVEVKKNPLVD